MSKSRLLIVEDDIDIANMLEIYFGGLHMKFAVPYAPIHAPVIYRSFFSHKKMNAAINYKDWNWAPMIT